jgi:hypothetical protein
MLSAESAKSVMESVRVSIPQLIMRDKEAHVEARAAVLCRLRFPTDVLRLLCDYPIGVLVGSGSLSGKWWLRSGLSWCTKR